MAQHIGDSDNASASREQRLAAKLRENLRRRKAQARGLADGGAAPESPTQDAGALPKPPGRS